MQFFLTLIPPLPFPSHFPLACFFAHLFGPHLSSQAGGAGAGGLPLEDGAQEELPPPPLDGAQEELKPPPPLEDGAQEELKPPTPLDDGAQEELPPPAPLLWELTW